MTTTVVVGVMATYKQVHPDVKKNLWLNILKLYGVYKTSKLNLECA